MNGRNSHRNSAIGLTTSSAVFSACWSAIVFGASSPRTMCSAVMAAKAIATEIECAVTAGIEPGRNAEDRLDRGGDSRFADPPEAEAGHRDAELRRPRCRAQGRPTASRRTLATRLPSAMS